jgi:stress-induced morphogen
MNDFLEFVRKKLKKNIKIESILVIDNSDLHKNHKFFDSKKYHLKLEIKSKYLNSLTKVKAQREVMKLFDEEFATKIHALEIIIK